MCADFTFIRVVKCIDYLIEASTTAAGVFKVALYGINTLDNQQKLLECVYQLHSSIALSEAHSYLAQHQLSTVPAELVSVPSKVNGNEVSLKANYRYLSTAQGTFIAAEVEFDQSYALTYVEASTSRGVSG